MGRRVLHMIGNAHIDPVWLWMAAEGRQETIDTCRSALERMDETEAFIFCCSTAAGYKWIEETDPELFGKVTTHLVATVAERWLEEEGLGLDGR